MAFRVDTVHRRRVSMITQFSLFDQVKAEEAKQDGMARAEAHADTEWQNMALLAVQYVALSKRTFIVDEVWQYIPSNLHTHNLRAMGPVMKRAQKLGWIEPCGHATTSRVSAHGTPVTLWQSKIYR